MHLKYDHCGTEDRARPLHLLAPKRMQWSCIIISFHIIPESGFPLERQKLLEVLSMAPYNKITSSH